MKTKNKDPNYHPIQFALNRAVFHKELTDAEADKGIAEYNALVAVAEAAAKYQDKVDGMTNSEFVNGKHFAEAIVLRETLSTLAAVYKQSPTPS